MEKESLKIEDFVITHKNGHIQLSAQDDLVLTSTDYITKKIDAEKSNIKWHFSNGDIVLRGQTIATFSGELCPLLSLETEILNVISHLTGISTYTKLLVEKIKSTRCKLFLSRNFTPGLEELEQQAFIDGGGEVYKNHFENSLFVNFKQLNLITDIEDFVSTAHDHLRKALEIEVSSLEQIEKIKDFPINSVLFSEMKENDIKKGLELLPRETQKGYYGSFNLSNIFDIANLGFDYINAGRVIHSAPAVDLNFKIDKGL